MSSNKEIEKIKEAIQDLVYDKTALRKAYQYYHAQRDAEQFKHLEDNYGIGSPTSVSFTPLIKKHIDVLVGEYLGLTQDLKITCKDSNTISNILRDKYLKINKEIHDYLVRYVHNNIIGAILDNKEAVNDPGLEDELNKLKENIEESFVSEYEIAAQNILENFRQSRNIDMKRKMEELYRDLLITGTGYYRTLPSANKKNVALEILNPIDTFIERNPNSPYLRDSRRAVIRKYMTKEEVLNKYHDELTQDAINSILEMNFGMKSMSDTYVVRYTSGNSEYKKPSGKKGILAGLEAHPAWSGDFSTTRMNNLIEVFEVEWLEVDKTNGKLTRHEGVQIGPEIFITRGESEFIVRSAENPNACGLSVNGMFFLDKNGDPYSLILNTMDLQDKYDLLIYCRDNLIASAGTVGDWIDVAFMPEFLGNTMPERVQAWKAYKKTGMALINSQMEGGERMTNTTFNGYDDTVKVQSIQAIQIAIDAIEQQASAITGVLPERLAQYEQRDAVTNVQLGVRMSGLLTKQYFEVMDIIYKEVNYDLLNLAKLVFPKGITGTLILGNKYSKIFNALPEHYTVTDFDIHIEDSSRSFKDMETAKSLNLELVKSGLSDPLMAFDVATATGLSELKQYVKISTEKKQKENDQIGQLKQQLEQATQDLKAANQQNEELQKQISKLNNQLDTNSANKLKLETERVAIEKEKVRNEKSYNDKIAEIKQQQLQIQKDEITDDNPYNNKVKAIM